jgi:hypothetical protein
MTGKSRAPAASCARNALFTRIHDGTSFSARLVLGTKHVNSSPYRRGRPIMPTIRVSEPTMRLIRQRSHPAYRFHALATRLDDGGWNVAVDDEAAFHVARERQRGESDDDVIYQLPDERAILDPRSRRGCAVAGWRSARTVPPPCNEAG